MERFSQINQFLHTSSFFYTIAIGMDSIYTFVSPNYDRNFSQGRGTLQGQHFSVTLHPEDIKLCAEVGLQCFEDPSRLFPVTLRKHDGKGGYVFTQWEMQAILTTDGKPEGIFCIGYNITEFENTREKLGRAETQLDEINYIQSHGVRKPLANIMGITALLDSEQGYTIYREFAGLLKESARELDDIIRKISQQKTD